MAATLANASVTSSQMPTTLLLADRPAVMKFGAQGELFLLWISAKLLLLMYRQTLQTACKDI